MDEWFNFGTIRSVLMDEWRGCEWERNMNYHRSAWLHIEDWAHSNQQSFQHGSRLCFLASLLGLESSTTMPRWNAECLLDVQCSSQHFENAMFVSILMRWLSHYQNLLTASTPCDNFRQVLRWILEKAQLYRWFLYVLCFYWSFPNTTVAVGFHLRWTRFYFKGLTLDKMIHCHHVIMCRQHEIKTLLENWLKTSWFEFHYHSDIMFHQVLYSSMKFYD